MPFGPSDPKAVEEAKKRDQAAPGISPDKIQRMAQAIMGQSGLDKSQLKLASDKTSSDQAVFKNGQGGYIKLALMEADLPPGMTATLDKNDVGAGEQAVLKVTYTPADKSKTPPAVTLRLVMEPFSRIFPVVVQFAPAQ